MNYSYAQVVLQEVPGEITLALSISGCGLRCKGCHSSETWDPKFGTILNTTELKRLFKENKYISCVLFYGGEWEPKELKHLLNISRDLNIKTALYTGEKLKSIPQEITQLLDYIKVGHYNEKLGGLHSKTTNQKFYKKINNLFVDYTHIFK